MQSLLVECRQITQRVTATARVPPTDAAQGSLSPPASLSPRGRDHLTASLVPAASRAAATAASASHSAAAFVLRHHDVRASPSAVDASAFPWAEHLDVGGVPGGHDSPYADAGQSPLAVAALGRTPSPKQCARQAFGMHSRACEPVRVCTRAGECVVVLRCVVWVCCTVLCVCARRCLGVVGASMESD